jgi:hypothetical protein
MSFDVDLDCTNRKVHENEVGRLAYADNANLLADNVDTVKRNTETLTDASEEGGLGINVEKTENVLLTRHQNVGQNRDIKIANRPFENVVTSNAGCYKKSFTTLKAYVSLFRGYVQCFELS